MYSCKVQDKNRKKKEKNLNKIGKYCFPSFRVRTVSISARQVFFLLSQVMGYDKLVDFRKCHSAED